MMLNRASLERPSSRSKRASLRNSLPLDDPQVAYMLYDQSPSAYHSGNPELATFLPAETDLDDPEHLIDAATLLSPHSGDEHDNEIFVPQPGSSSPLDMYHQHHHQQMMYGLIGDNKVDTPCGHRQMGIYGWRKKIIYLLLAAIVLLVGINAALTFWILSVLGFSSNGISGLDVSQSEQIVFKGNAIFERLLFASEVSSYHSSQQWLRFVQRNGDISFRSSWIDEPPEPMNATISPSVPNRIDSRLTVSKGKVLVEADNFELYDRSKRLVFALNSKDSALNTTSNSSNRNHKMTIRVDSLNVQNLNSLSLPLSLQTPLLESSSEELKIASPQGRVLLRGPSSVAIESKFGDASMMTFGGLRLKSNSGKLILESANGIYLRKLAELSPSNPSTTPASIIQRLRQPKVYQVCICSSGKLFLVNPDQQCAVQSNKDCY